jgi:hypothetical protein
MFAHCAASLAAKAVGFVRELFGPLTAARADGRAGSARASSDGAAGGVLERYGLLAAAFPVIVAQLRSERRL